MIIGTSWGYVSDPTYFEKWPWTMSGVDVHELLISFGVFMPYVAILIVIMNLKGWGLKLDWRRDVFLDDFVVPERIAS